MNIRLFTRGHYAYALGYFDARTGKPFDDHYSDPCLKGLYGLGYESGLSDKNEFDTEAL